MKLDLWAETWQPCLLSVKGDIFRFAENQAIAKVFLWEKFAL